jgi:hypothetical protein
MKRERKRERASDQATEASFLCEQEGEKQEQPVAACRAQLLARACQDCCQKTFATKRKTMVHTLGHHPIHAFLFSLFLAALGGFHFL